MGGSASIFKFFFLVRVSMLFLFIDWQLFNGMTDIANFTLLVAAYFCIPMGTI